jgi:hypothetical protein
MKATEDPVSASVSGWDYDFSEGNRWTSANAPEMTIVRSGILNYLIYRNDKCIDRKDTLAMAKAWAEQHHHCRASARKPTAVERWFEDCEMPECTFWHSDAYENYRYAFEEYGQSFSLAHMLREIRFAPDAPAGDYPHGWWKPAGHEWGDFLLSSPASEKPASVQHSLSRDEKLMRVSSWLLILTAIYSIVVFLVN